MKKGSLNYHYIQDYNPPKIYSDIQLLQIGTAHLQPNTTVELHTHVDFFELTVVTSGKGKIITNNSSIPVEKGDIYVSFPFDQHRIDSDEETPMNYNFIAFFVTNKKHIGDTDEITALYSHPAERILNDDTVSLLLASAISEIRKDGIYKEEYISSLLTQIAIQVIRNFKKQDTPIQVRYCSWANSLIETKKYTVLKTTYIKNKAIDKFVSSLMDNARAIRATQN